MGVPTNEHRTTILCCLCRKRNVEPKGQPNHRYRTCIDCCARMDLEILPASVITTHVSKRKMQKRRRELRNMNMGEDVDMAPAEEPPPQHGPFRPLEQPRPLILVSKKEYFVKTDRLVDASVERKVTVKNRDVNAGRNILCIGLYILMVLVIHFQLMGIFLFHFRIVRGHRPTIGSSIHRTSIRRP